LVLWCVVLHSHRRSRPPHSSFPRRALPSSRGRESCFIRRSFPRRAFPTSRGPEAGPSFPRRALPSSRGRESWAPQPPRRAGPTFFLPSQHRVIRETCITTHTAAMYAPPPRLCLENGDSRGTVEPFPPEAGPTLGALSPRDHAPHSSGLPEGLALSHSGRLFERAFAFFSSCATHGFQMSGQWVREASRSADSITDAHSASSDMMIWF